MTEPIAHTIPAIVDLMLKSTGNFSSDLFEKEKIDESLNVVNTKQFPTKQEENWKHTSLTNLKNENFVLAEKNLQNTTKQTIEGLATLVQSNNGFFSINESTKQYEIVSFDQLNNDQRETVKNHLITQTISASRYFEALGVSYIQHGLMIRVFKNQDLSIPLTLLHSIQTEKNSWLQPRILIIVEQGAKCTLFESFEEEMSNTSVNALNIQTDVFVNKNANFEYIRLQKQKSYAVHNLNVVQQEGSSFKQHTFTLSGVMVRNESYAQVVGENCYTELNGLYLPKDKQHVDNFTYINHLKPHCSSRQVFKGIVDDKASAVFLGRVHVAKNSQKTDAYQNNKNILLTREASVNSKPQLEIYADDVKCSHGSTIGQIDGDAIFYLQSRGISKIEAQKLLLQAYTLELTDCISNDTIKNYLSNEVENLLK